VKSYNSFYGIESTEWTGADEIRLLPEHGADQAVASA